MDYYSILGVAPGASEQEIKKAYRRMANRHHPDKGGDPVEFHKIQQAYDALTNPQPESPSQENPWGDMNDIFGDYVDQVFRGKARGFDQRIRNPDKNLRVTITAEQAYTGSEILVEGTDVREVIKITPGIHDGARLRIREKGHQTFRQAPPGDLIIRVNVIYPPGTIRKGDDLYQESTVDALDAMLGAEITVKHVSGKNLKVKVPQGTQNHSKLRLSNWGYPNNTTGHKGNFYVILNIRVPNITNPQHIELLKKINQEVKKP